MNLKELIAAMEATAAEKPRAVVVPGWGTVYVRSQTVAEVDEMTDVKDEFEGKQKLARSAACVICDETGKRLFDPNKREDVERLAKQPWPLLNKVLNASRILGGEDGAGN